jgi:hypothetical protein
VALCRTFQYFSAAAAHAALIHRPRSSLFVFHSQGFLRFLRRSFTRHFLLLLLIFPCFLLPNRMSTYHLYRKGVTLSHKNSTAKRSTLFPRTMSGINQPTQNQPTHWGDSSSPQLPSIGGLSQPPNVWPSSGLFLPHPQPNWSHVSPGVSLQSPFNATEEQGARLQSANLRGNNLSSSTSQNPVASHPGPIVTQGHGRHEIPSNAVETGLVDSIPSKRPRRKSKAPHVGDTQWEQKSHI